MRRALSFVLIFVVTACVVLAAAPSNAQFARASLSGLVVDPDGAALPGVTVTARNEASGFSRTVVTSANGRFVFNGLIPGTYTLTAELQGFRGLERSGIELRVGQESSLNLQMELGGIEEILTVTAQSPMVEVTSKEVGGTLTSQEFADLPSQNRSFVLFASLLPGVTPFPDTESTSSDSLFINGQDDNNNSFNVDGANNDDDVIGARAGAQTRTALEAIQEFQILTTQFDAEFGRTTGGVLNAVTRSGGNAIHGVGFFYYQDSDLNEKNFFTERNDLEQPDFTFQSAGGTVGGPIVKDVAHFFGSFERNKPQEGVAQSFSTRPDLNFVTTEDNLVRNWLGKIDWQVTESNKASFRYLREFSPQFNQIIGPVTLAASREEDDKDTNLIGSFDSVVTDTAFNNLRVSFTREDVAFANPGFNNNGQTFEAQRALDVSEARPSFVDGASVVASARVNNSLQIDDTLSWYLPDWHGDHDLRIGGQYSRRTVKFNNSTLANGQFGFDTDRAFDPSDITTFPVSFLFRFGGPSGGGDQEVPANNVFGLFLQDDWQPTENLTLNLGLRYDWEEVVDDNDNIGPRIGFTWDPLGQGRTAVRGGWGRFYERFQLGDGGFASFFLDAVRLNQGFLFRFPSAGGDQQFFFDFAQTNGITTLNGLRDALIALFEAGGGSALNPFPTVDNADRVSPFADTFTIGVEHEVAPNVSVSADFVHTENQDQLLFVNLNPFSLTRGRPNISILDGQPIALGSITTHVNAGESTYDGLQLSVHKRMSDTPVGPLFGRVSYTLARQEGNANAGFSGGQFAYFQEFSLSGFDFDTGQVIGEPLNLNLDNPANVDRPSPWHRTHNFVTSWSWIVPGTSWKENEGLMISGVYRWMSGDRDTYFLFSRLDNGNREIAPAGTFDANNPIDISQGPIEFDGRINGAEAPDFQRLDLSFRYRIPFDVGTRPYDVTVLADVFNISNEVNFRNIGSSFVQSGAFLNPTRAFVPREFQIGIRFTY